MSLMRTQSATRPRPAEAIEARRKSGAGPVEARAQAGPASNVDSGTRAGLLLDRPARWRCSWTRESSGRPGAEPLRTCPSQDLCMSAKTRRSRPAGASFLWTAAAPKQRLRWLQRKCLHRRYRAAAHRKGAYARAQAQCPRERVWKILVDF